MTAKNTMRATAKANNRTTKRPAAATIASSIKRKPTSTQPKSTSKYHWEGVLYQYKRVLTFHW
jgi:hypothetical protein